MKPDPIASDHQAPPLNYARLYANFHPDTPEHQRGLTRLHQRLLIPHLPADRSVPVLDIGCGRGYALQFLESIGYANVAGIETDAGQVAYAQAKNLKVTAVKNAATFLTERPASYGVILLMDVLEHVPHAEQPDLLRAIISSLRPGGLLICSVPNAASVIHNFWLHNDYTHQGSFTKLSLEFLLSECGFSTVQCTGVEVTTRPRFLFWLPIPRTIAWWLRCLIRGRMRLTYVAELGWQTGWPIPLTPNLLACARRN